MSDPDASLTKFYMEHQSCSFSKAFFWLMVWITLLAERQRALKKLRDLQSFLAICADKLFNHR
ncbi:MAG: hypothetical protein ACLFP8_08835 [Alphaproteobacteria bacterium]